MGELPLFLRVPRTERTAFAMVWSRVVFLLQKKKRKLQFMLNLNPKPIDKHWTLSLFNKAACDKEGVPAMMTIL